MSDEIVLFEWPPLPCDCVIYRAVTRRSWLDPETGQPLAEAYMRKPGHDDDGVSVALFDEFPAGEAELCQKIDHVTGNECYGLTSLHTGYVRSLQLEVEQDEPEHALITGLPFDDEESHAEAEMMADRLVELSWIRWYRKKKKGWSDPARPLVTTSST